MNIAIRPAQAADVPHMHALMLPLMQEHTLIMRDEDDIFEHLQEFIVALKDDVLVGVAALHVYGTHLAEIRSLAVAPEARGMRIGHRLVESCETMSRKLGIDRVFALTYVDGFFTRQGYTVVAKESLPQKVWTVCIHCPKFSHCDEIAVVKNL